MAKIKAKITYYKKIRAIHNYQYASFIVVCNLKIEINLGFLPKIGNFE